MNAQIQRLFANKSFQRDLPKIAALPAEVFEKIQNVMKEAAKSRDLPYTDDDAILISEDTGQPLILVNAAMSLIGVLAGQFAQDLNSVAEVETLVREQIPDQSLSDALVSRVRNVPDVAYTIEATFRRREAITRASRTLTDIEYSCSLRLRTTESQPGFVRDIQAYDPEVAELIPIVNLELSFEAATEQSGSVFQLTLADVQRLIGVLQVAEKQLRAATSTIEIRKKAGSIE
jgi:hypothetical protein